MADHLATDFGNQGHRSKSASTQSIDQASFTILSEGKAIHLANGLVVQFILNTNEKRYSDERLARSDDDWLRQIDPAAIANLCSSKQAQPLTCFGVDLDDRNMRARRDAFKVKAGNDPVVSEAEGEPGVMVKGQHRSFL